MQRCSSEAGVRDCPPHRPEEQWLSCFARLQRETPKQKYRRSIERKSNQLYASLMPQESLDTGGRANLLLEGGKSIERADSALDLLPPAKLRRGATPRCRANSQAKSELML